MATFGLTNPGTETPDDSGDIVRGSKGTLTDYASVTSMSAYLGAKGAGTDVLVTCAAYTGNSGTPSVKELETVQGTVSGTAQGWVSFNVDPPVVLTAGVYWLTWGNDGSAGGVTWSGGTLTNGVAYAGMTYPTFPDPFGSPTYQNSIASIYATYTPLTPTENIYSADFESSSKQNYYILAQNVGDLGMTGDRTIECWANNESLPGASAAMTIASVWNDQNASRNYAFSLLNVGGTYSLRLSLNKTGGTTEDLTVEIPTPSAEQWYHYAVTWDASESTMVGYLNGTAQGTTSGANTSTDAGTSSAFLVGGFTDGVGNLGNAWDGKIDELRIWNDIRTANELSVYRNQQISGTHSDLIAGWRFNGDRLDITSNSYDLNAVAGSTFPSFSTDVPFTVETTSTMNLASKYW